MLGAGKSHHISSQIEYQSACQKDKSQLQSLCIDETTIEGGNIIET